MKESYKRANCCSVNCMCWQSALIKKTNKNKDLLKEDLIEMKEKDSCKNLESILEVSWKKEIKRADLRNKKPSIKRAFLRAFGCRFLGFTLIAFFSELMMPLMMFSLKFIIEYLEDDNASQQEGVILVLTFCVFSFINIYLRHVALFHAYTYILVIRKSAVGLLYNKMLRLTQKALAKATSGKIINLASGDLSSLERTFHFSPYIIISPVIFIVSISEVSILIGWYTFIVLGMVIFFYLLQTCLNAPLVRLRSYASKATDVRLKIINELINGIRVIKAYAWENALMKKIIIARNQESKRYMKLMCLRGLVLGISRYVGILIFMPIVILQVVNDGGIVPGETYALYGLVLFIGLQSITVFSFAMQAYAEFDSFLQRLGEVLILEEFNPPSNESKLEEGQRLKAVGVSAAWGFQLKGLDIDKQLTMKMSQASLDSKQKLPQKPSEAQQKLVHNLSITGAPPKEHEVISQINFSLYDSDLVVVIGQVGSGKSSLLATIMKECQLRRGDFSVNGELAYVEQEPFILSDTIKYNITLGKELNEARLQEVIKVCQLESDLLLFPKGIDTFIGQQGVNISGGQKARIALARAVYSDADVYLLDDPLSAVDPAVADKIFKGCIQGYLASKARILVTHQLHFITDLPRILLLDSSGRQKFFGSYDSLVASDVMDIAKILESFQTSGKDPLAKKRALRMIKRNRKLTEGLLREQSASTFLQTELMSQADVEEEPEQKEKPEVKKDQGGKDNLIVSEQRALGGAKCRDYCFSLKNGNCCCNFLGLMVVILFPASLMYFQLFLAGWVNQSPSDQKSTLNISLLVTIIVVLNLLTIALSIIIFLIVLLIGKNLHNKMIIRVSRALISFFDSNPSGRIINRFSKDTAVLDAQLPMMFFFLIAIALQLMVSLVLSIVVIPLMAAVLVILVIIMYFLKRNIMIVTNEALKWDGVSRSPMNSLFSATLRGIMTIRAYNKQKDFTKNFQHLVDQNGKAFFTFITTSRQFGMRLDMVTYVYIAVNIALAILLRFWLDQDPALVGMSITLTMELGGAFQYLIRMLIEIENAMTSVQRMREYINLPTQADSFQPGDRDLIEQNWPTEGSIVFKDFVMRYRPTFDPVLHDLNFIVQGGMKIGVVGRTGAGKSSILQALFRLVEKDPNGGYIELDGVDISKVGLTTLRESLGIIPQSPFLFIGSIKENLDPFHLYTNHDLWQALEDVQLAQFVRSQRCNSGLETHVSDSSSLFSTGQRQLLCLARAILRKSKVLVLDEATANVDMETDQLIQSTIRTRFRDCTVITVAHRLATIIDSHRVLVLGAGHLLEYEHPFNLLAVHQDDQTITKKQGHFAQMVLATGKQSAQSLFNVAKESFCKLNS